MRTSGASASASLRSRTSPIRSPGSCSSAGSGTSWGNEPMPTETRSSAIIDLFTASRPLSWVNTAFPFAAAYLLTTREVDVAFIVGTLFFLVPYNLAMYGVNDVFDYASDAANPRKGGAEGALLTPARHRATLI